MSFSKDVKSFLYEARNNSRSDCCKASFDAGASGKPAEFICNRCNTHYISGVFYGFGTMSDPSKGFQLFIYPPKESEEFILSLLEEAVPPKIGVKNGKNYFYYKSCESVCDFLAFCRASSFSLKVHEEGVDSQEKSLLQRKFNAEMANMARVADAAFEQLDAIRLLKKYGMIENLKKELKEAALLRETYPEAGLSELVDLSPTAVSKSGLNYRLKKLIAMAEDLKSQEEL